MDAVFLNAVVGEDGHLIVDTVVDLPAGPVQVMVTPDTPVLTREIARARLLAGGLLATDLGIPDDLELEEVSEEELEELSHLIPPGRPSDELIDEDRGTH